MTLFFRFYTAFVAALLGAVMGSFLNCAAIRLIHHEPLSRGRSHCVHCGHTLGVRDLIPLASFLLLRGRCRYCGQRLSPRYLFAELISALVFLSLWLKFGLTLRCLELLILASLCLCLSFCDLEDYIIPDRFILAGILVRAVFILLSGDLPHTALRSLIGGLSVALPVLILVLIMEKILKKEAMGGGDLKLLFMLGLYFPWSLNFLGILLACVIGILFGLAALRRDRMIPFGPSICLGSWISCLFGQPLIEFYLSLF